MRPTLKRWLDFLCTLAFVGFALTLAMLVHACTPDAGKNARTAADYEASQLACVDHARTLAESHACRDAVAVQFGRPTRWTDAGAPLRPMSVEDAFGPLDAGEGGQ